MTVVWILSLVAGGITVCDQLRRPASHWTAADRDRSYWVGSAIVGGFICLGIPVAIAYAIAVLPRFGSAASAQFHHAAPAPHVVSPPQPPGVVPPSVAPPAGEPRKLVIDIEDMR